MRRHLPLLAAAMLSLGLAMWATFPAWLEPSTRLIGHWVHPDCLGNHWLLSWVAEQVSHGRGILHNDRYWWPIGDAPVLAGNGDEGFLYLPFHLALGWPRGVPYYALLVLTLDGLAGWAVARAAGAGPWSSLAAVGITGSSAYVFMEMSSGRFTQSDTFWLGFFMAAWLAFLQRPSRGRAVLAGVLLAATAFFYWYYGFFAVICGGILLLARGRHRPGWRLLVRFSLAFLLPISPWAYLFIDHWRSIPGTAELSVFPPAHAYSDAAPPMLPFLVSQGPTAETALPITAFLAGVVGLVLALLAALGRPVRGWTADRGTATGLLSSWLAFRALALGPVFPHAPYTLLYGLAAPLRRFWWPLRHLVVARLAWAALAALAITALCRHHRRLAAGLALGISISIIPLLRHQRAPGGVKLSHIKLPPPVYPKLANMPGKVLVEPPLTPEASGAEQQLIYQLWHHKTLLGGHGAWVDRVRPDAWDAFMASNSFLAELQAFERGELHGTFRFDAEDLQNLLDRGVRWYAVNREYFVFGLRELVLNYRELFSALFGEPLLRGTGIAVWDATAWNGRTEVPVPEWHWPPTVRREGPDMPVTGMRPRSRVFVGGR